MTVTETLEAWLPYDIEGFNLYWKTEVSTSANYVPAVPAHNSSWLDCLQVHVYKFCMQVCYTARYTLIVRVKETARERSRPTYLSRIRMDRRAEKSDVHSLQWRRTDCWWTSPLQTWHFCRRTSTVRRTSAVAPGTWLPAGQHGPSAPPDDCRISIPCWRWQWHRSSALAQRGSGARRHCSSDDDPTRFLGAVFSHDRTFTVVYGSFNQTNLMACIINQLINCGQFRSDGQKLTKN